MKRELNTRLGDLQQQPKFIFFPSGLEIISRWETQKPDT
ncbi:hypothetical protein B6N60_04436 [Richelia sinica FACHB-800]|uniref:Uncharacterized protein n=1 Tax=Richelia sinica FACHB-800 TaxID=1357546 RepID=A0A975TBF5_9NOST|nr:hypothetical protein B6N60_04436 [Richelia sinica FACHB-800]